MNKVVIIGRVGKEPELRYTAAQTAVTSFSVATSKKVNNEERTQWHNVVVWAKLAEVCSQYVKKGMLVGVEGEINYKQWEKDGETKYGTEIIGSNVEFLTPAKDRTIGATRADVSETPNLEDIPF